VLDGAVLAEVGGDLPPAEHLLDGCSVVVAS
jgi:hypothetical protein